MTTSIFEADVSTIQYNCTGNGFNYQPFFENVFINEGSDYDGYDTFTMPATANNAMWLNFHIIFLDITSLMNTAVFGFYTSNRYYVIGASPSAEKRPDGCYSILFGTVCDMDEGDTANVLCQIQGGVANSATVLAGTFSGFYIN